MKKKYYKIIAVILSCVLVFNACSSSENVENNTENNRSVNSSEDNSEKANSDVENDQRGTTIPTEQLKTSDVTSEQEQSITTSPSITEILTSTPAPTEEPVEEDEDALYNSSPITNVENMEYTYYGKTGLYTGEWKGDRPQGKGRLSIDDDNYYDGEWDYGYINGNAKMAYIDDDGAVRFYSGDCACNTIVGYGLMTYWTDTETKDLIGIVGDFSNEETLVYYSIENGEIIVDMGYVRNGMLDSEVDHICDDPESPLYSHDTEVIIYNDMFNGTGARSYVGYYSGDKNSDGNPEGYGVFQLVGETFPRNMYTGSKYIETEFLHSKIVIGKWVNGRLTGNYVVYDVVKPTNEEYFDYAHECKKDYYYRIDNVLDKKVSYVDKTCYYDDGSVADDFYIYTCHYADYTLESDGIYRAGLDESDVYYRQDYMDGKTLLPAGTYCRVETYPCYVEEKGEKKYFEEGFRAYYDSEGEMFRYIEYDKDHRFGNVVVGDEWKKLGNALLIAGTIFFGALATYKIIASTGSGKITAKANTKEYDFSEEKRYAEQKEKAEALRKQARELEAELRTGTLWEYEVNEIKRQIQDLYDEANRIEPSIFN